MCCTVAFKWAWGRFVASFEFHRPMRYVWSDLQTWTDILEPFSYSPITFTSSLIIVQGTAWVGSLAGWRLTMTPQTSFSGTMSSSSMPEGVVSSIELRDPSGALFLTVRNVGMTFTDIRVFGLPSLADTMIGTSGDDSFAGGHDNDSASGGAGNDRLWGDNGDDVLVGGDGADILEGGLDNDRLEGGSGNDELLGDRAVGPNGGADQLFGGDGHDILRGGHGDDVLWGDGGSDVIHGDAGYDVARFAGARSSYEVRVLADRIIVLRGGDKDVLHGVEALQFDDTTFDPGMIVCDPGGQPVAAKESGLGGEPPGVAQARRAFAEMQSDADWFL